MKWKVCGMREVENIREVALLNPDYMGFIFYEKSPRNFTTSKDIFPFDSLKNIKKTGVFVNASLTFIQERVALYQLNAIQLHGDETPEMCAAIQQQGLEVIKAFGIDEGFDFAHLKSFKKVCDYFLFDTKGISYGGNGKTFDWKLLEEYDNEVPLFLSGGLETEHLEKIKELSWLNIYALDINSRFEVSPGKKDLNKIIAFKESFDELFVNK